MRRYFVTVCHIHANIVILLCIDSVLLLFENHFNKHQIIFFFVKHLFKIPLLAIAILLPFIAIAQSALNPIGGGYGYSRIINSNNATSIVSSWTGLKSAIKNSSPGDVIYIQDNAKIEIPHGETISIQTPNLTIASGRGKNDSDGAKLYTNHPDQKPINVSATNVRITGIRLQGHTGLSGSCNGIRVSGKNIEIDNCEIYRWSYAAISLGVGASDDRSHVHHNYIHHNSRAGLGYGVVVGNKTNAIVENNIFDYNRHDIAGGGVNPYYLSYEAFNNISLKQGVNKEPKYDMHGAYEACGSGYHNTNWAGKSVKIHDNTVHHHDAYYHIKIRGIPTASCQVVNNYFKLKGKHPTFRAAEKDPTRVRQACSQNGLGYNHKNVDFSRTESFLGGVFSMNNNKYSIKDVVWKVAWNGRTTWRIISYPPIPDDRIAVADFDGNGTDDIFFQEDGYWWIAPSGCTPLVKIGQSGYQRKDLAFGDFNGDGQADILRLYYSKWRISYSQSPRSWTGWQDAGDKGGSLSQLKFGDFDGDGKTDALWAKGSSWKISYSRYPKGFTSWITKSSLKEKEIEVGDFDGDGKTDLFKADGSKWWVAYNNYPSNFTKWEVIGYSNTRLSHLKFADFNNDGKTDIFCANGKKFLVSFSRGRGVTATSWSTINSSSIKTKDLKLGDFDGNGHADVLRTGPVTGTYYHSPDRSNSRVNIANNTDSFYSDDLQDPIHEFHVLKKNFETGLSLDKKSFDLKLSVFPNPTNSIVNIKTVSQLNEDLTLIIIDNKSQTILSKKICSNHEYTFDISHLKKGSYIISIIGSQHTKHKTFLIN